MSKVLILTGHSGAGKDTVSDRLQAAGLFKAITPITTRAMREGESEGNPYEFVPVQVFQAMIARGLLIEHKSYVTQFNGVPDTAYYGTAFASIPENEDSVITIGVNASIELKEKLGDRAVLVYLNVSDSVREERAKARGSFDQVEWDNRLAQDHKRFKDGLPDGIDFTVDSMQPIELVVESLVHHYNEVTT